MRNRRNSFIKKGILTAAGVLWLFAISGTGIVFAAQSQSQEQTSIDSESAEALALSDAGISADETQRLRTETEREHGETIYEITFLAEDIEYEYHIRESDGKIIEWEIDGRNINAATAEQSLQNAGENGNGNPESTDTLIGLKEAKKAALTDAKLEETDVTFSTIKFEDDERTTVYEIEFYWERQEFEYEIDAYTGEILKMERD